jgi:TolB protein
MRNRVKSWLLTIARRLGRTVRGILGLPGRLSRSIARVPAQLWQAFQALVRFLVYLPLRLWRALKALVRFLVHLPMRLWQALQALGRFLVRLPGRLWGGLKRAVFFVLSLPGRLLAAVRRRISVVRTWLRERRDRFVHWWRTRVLPPRTASPRLQVLLLGLLIGSVALIVMSGRTLLGSSGDRQPAPTSLPSNDPPSLRPVVALTPTRPASLQTPVASPGAAADSSLSGAVAFSLRRDGNTDVYVLKTDDDQLLRLTYHPAEDREPAWAPDGETLAFTSQRGNNWDIYRLDLLSGALLRLTRDPHYDGHPSWSPDGAFVAFESYRSGNLDVFIMAADGSEVHQLTANQAADFAPAWSPDGRHIAFVSYRDGSKDVYLYPLDAGSESAIINLTQTPDRDEDAPSWSPGGSRLAFSVGRFGAQTIYITTFDWSSKYLEEATIQLFNPGTAPEWAPDGNSLVYQYRLGSQVSLVADSVNVWGSGEELYSSDMAARDPNWGDPRIDPQIVARQRETAPVLASLFIEEILPSPKNGPPYTIAGLKDVNGGDDREFLSDRVDDSFQALRQRVLQETGEDYLASIGDSFRAIEVEPPPGQSPHSWHKAGRAFDLNQGLYEREEQLVELVREDIGFRTYWRVYLRAARQDGSLGEPLHDAPWDLKARQEGGLAAREGGEQAQEVPMGYYVDFTALAADYGWERVPANNSWRRQWADINWWQFQKTQGLTWLQAMQELYRLDQIEAVFGPQAEDGP